MAAAAASAYVYWTLKLVFCCTVILSILIRVWPRKTRRRGCSPLPPGSRGWLPVVGETWEYARPNQALLFLRKRVLKYGELFQSHLFGEPIIISCSSRINHHILQQEFKLFKSSYPKTFIKVLGDKNVLALPKDLHKKVRGFFSNTSLASKLRTHECINNVFTTIAKVIDQWDERVVRVHDELTKMAYLLVAKKLLGLIEDEPECKALMDHYFCLVEGLISFPINFPGTAYHKSLQARSKILKIIDEIIAKRIKANSNYVCHDFLDALIEDEQRSNTTEARAMTRDVILSVLFAGHDTVSKAMTFAVKYLLDHPNVLQLLREEHMALHNQAKDGKALTWEHFKSLTFSNNVIAEILRLTNIAPCVFREALEDVEIDGFTIPKGYKVMASLTLNHFEPSKFEEPFDFNPCRWQSISPSDTSYMPFGGGPRLCPGGDFAKLQICIFLHHLVLKYKFKQVEEDEIVYSPVIKFKKGLPTFFKRYE